MMECVIYIAKENSIIRPFDGIQTAMINSKIFNGKSTIIKPIIQFVNQVFPSVNPKLRLSTLHS